jgi:hypothetical protein
MLFKPKLINCILFPLNPGDTFHNESAREGNSRQARKALARFSMLIGGWARPVTPVTCDACMAIAKTVCFLRLAMARAPHLSSKCAPPLAGDADVSLFRSREARNGTSFGVEHLRT